MPRPISVTISVSALAHNLGVVRERVAQAARQVAQESGVPKVAPAIWAVIKAHGYGHGIEQAAQGFAQADGLAMLDLAEAVRCREAGWTKPIMLLEGYFDASDLQVVSQYRLTSVVHAANQLDMLRDAKLGRPLDIFLKLNTGMNRLGFAPHDYRAAFDRARALQERGTVATLGRMTHFANADGPVGIADQVATFRRVAGDLPGPASLCNSAATLRYPEIAAADQAGASWVRPGICLYGASPFDNASAASFGLQPSMSLRSRIIAVQHLRAGDCVGYGSLFRAEAPIRVGVVACGYADGYPRHAPTGTPVMVGGVRTRVLGRVSMDMLVADLTPVPDAGVGAPVSLWGADGPSVDEVASASGTIGYELLCALAPRVPVRTAA